MKSFEQLAQAAYAAYCETLGCRIDVLHRPWASLQPGEKECWLAAVKAVAAELQSVH